MAVSGGLPVAKQLEPEQLRWLEQVCPPAPPQTLHPVIIAHAR